VKKKEKKNKGIIVIYSFFPPCVAVLPNGLTKTAQKLLMKLKHTHKNSFISEVELC
jgi:hypothetical protein